MKNWLIPGCIALLALVSILILRSIAPQLAAIQAFFFIVGLIIFYFLAKIKLRLLQNFAWPLYALLIIFLIISQIYGWTTGNTGRWIPILGIFNAQPSQLAIPIVALVLTSLSGSFNELKQLVLALVIIIVPAILILIEPDLGTTIAYLVSTGVILFVSDLSWKKIFYLGLAGFIVAVFAWFFVLQPYQKERIASFTDRSDVQDASYNARQSLIAVGSGQLTGRGLGGGSQSHLRFLPERQTDFIFASFAEEFGFVGSAAVLALYTALIAYIIWVAYQADHQSQLYYCLSIVTMLTIQVVVNIGMNIGLLPITGITLPMLSYGGSSIIAFAISLAVVQSIAKETKQKAVLHLS